MLKKSDITLLRELKDKKNRYHNGLFVAEGTTLIQDIIKSGFALYSLYTVDVEPFAGHQPIKISLAELQRISSQKNPNTAVAVFKIPTPKSINPKGLIVALDDLNDPGNLGTILRTCDWFGVEHVVCSKNTVDCYNSKVVQSSMGSLAHVSVHYLDLYSFLREATVSIFGAYSNGLDVRTVSKPVDAILVMGNEASGISRSINAIIKNRITIPRFGNRDTPESLNVAISTAILLNEFRSS